MKKIIAELTSKVEAMKEEIVVLTKANHELEVESVANAKVWEEEAILANINKRYVNKDAINKLEEEVYNIEKAIELLKKCK